MSQNFALTQNLAIAAILNPATDAAGRTGAWVNAKNAHKIFIVAHITQGNAATILLSVLQATSSGGAGSKALANVARIWANQDTGTAANVLTRQTDAVSFTTSAATTNKIVVIEVDPAMLDLANGFSFVTISTGASNVANITAAIVYETPRSAEDPVTSILV
jgi:hypothetical protein